ncbi:MAG: hypothetical protein RR412_13335 [Burkholderiaceae bacterium]
MSVMIFLVDKKSGALLAALAAMHFAGFEYANIAFIVVLVAVFCWISTRVMQITSE